ncbi:MAG: helix-turn-helix domain-containing protein [Kiloniellales bacterium]|nr:helix-turn-helix domain-containing protein [Kiloniellales bacterium]
MSKAGTKLLRAARQASAIARGEADPDSYRVHVPEAVDVKAIRKGLEMTQAEFSQSFGISLSTLRKWEQEGRQPEGPARAYLKVIQREPNAVRRALSG